MVYHDLGYSTETIFTGVFKGILHFHRFFKAKNPSSANYTQGTIIEHTLPNVLAKGLND